jgi:hypothetical protein
VVQIQVLPMVLFFVDGVVKDRVIGFEDFGQHVCALPPSSPHQATATRSRRHSWRSGLRPAVPYPSSGKTSPLSQRRLSLALLSRATMMTMIVRLE